MTSLCAPFRACLLLFHIYSSVRLKRNTLASSWERLGILSPSFRLLHEYHLRGKATFHILSYAKYPLNNLIFIILYYWLVFE